MTKKLIKEQVDIYEYPDKIVPNSGSITIGDLHGNAVKLLHFLLRHNVVKFKEGENGKEIFDEFVELYEKSDLIPGYYSNIRMAQGRVDGHKKDLKELQDRRDELIRIEKRSDEEEDNLNALNGDGAGSIKYKQRLIDNQQKVVDENRLSLQELDLKDIPVKFNAILSKLETVSEKTLVRLIGDELADRGSNDYYTLKLLGFLHTNKVNVNIIGSNHSNEFIRAYEQLDYALPEGGMDGKQRKSFAGLKLLLDENIVSKEEVTQLVNEAYKPTLKILDYTLSNDGITLFTHAPVRFDRIERIAARLGVVYDDSTNKALAATIDKINTRFADIVKNNKVQEYCSVNLLAGKADAMEPAEVEKFPLIDIMWNRWDEKKDTEDARPGKVNNYPVLYVHGHDPYQSKYPHVVNLDTECGKGMRRELENKVAQAQDAILNKTEDSEYAEKYLESLNEYKVLDSNEKGLGQKHSLRRIGEEYRQSQLMSPAKRTGLITGVLAAVGLALGIAVGIALVATGVFAPFGVGILGAAALAATIGGGVALVTGSLGFAVAKNSEPNPVNTVINQSQFQEIEGIRQNGGPRQLSKLGGGPGETKQAEIRNDNIDKKENDQENKVILHNENDQENTVIPHDENDSTPGDWMSYK
ncbi:MAG: Dot/Icm T4SS effector Wip [Tatlockia sp.]|jgi:hypothetical protein